ncbi:MAG: hypothetical protein HYX92_04370 [Chloroflexi bacterium]|nr:hypothetical protein [Chloroflexota bacterium]
MELLVAVTLAVIVIALAILLYWRASQSTVLRRLGRIVGAHVESMGAPAREEERGLNSLRPGDAISFWDGADCTVETILNCEERVGERVTSWRWVFLSGGRLLEVAPDGNTMFEGPEVLHQGSAGFQRLTAEAEDGGILKTFEARVREGAVAASPVSFRHGRFTYSVRSTGAFRATAVGKTLEQEVWRDIGPKAEDNVYFEMETGAGKQALGVWTTHILLLSGETLKETDITDIFAKQQ